MGAYEARVEQQNKVGGPKPGEQNKYTQATVLLSSAARIHSSFPAFPLYNSHKTNMFQKSWRSKTAWVVSWSQSWPKLAR